MYSSISFLFIIVTVTAFHRGGHYGHSRNCPENLREIAVECKAIVFEFVANTASLDIQKPKTVEAFKQTCDALKICNKVLTCGGVPPKSQHKVEEANEMARQCDAIVFMSTEFADCAVKLKGSSCYNSFDPLHEFTVTDVENGGCEHFFGHENCMKEEVYEHCGQKMVDRFQDFFLASNRLALICDIRSI